MVIITALTPILTKIVEGTREIKDGLKFNDLLKQYEDIMNIQKKAQKELEDIKKETRDSGQTQKTLLDEIQKHVTPSDTASSIMEDPSFRERVLWKIFSDPEKKDPSLQGIFEKWKKSDPLTVEDMVIVYRIPPIEQEQPFIKKLQKGGLDQATIARLLSKRKQLILDGETLKKTTTLKWETELKLADLEQRLESARQNYNRESDSKLKALLLKEMDDLNTRISNYTFTAGQLDSQIQIQRQRYIGEHNGLYDSSHIILVKHQMQNQMGRYYQNKKGKSLEKWSLFDHFFNTHIVKGGR